MTYQELLVELGRLRGVSNVLVTGPQRSGTTIVAHAIAHDLQLDYVDEDDIGWVGASENDIDELRYLLDVYEGLVIQAPACAHICHTLPEDVVIVFVGRDVGDIIASQERINWSLDSVELKKYPPEYRAEPVAETKYAYWEDVQKPQIRHAYEVEYESLSGHDLWIDRRGNFGARQWK